MLSLARALEITDPENVAALDAAFERLLEAIIEARIVYGEALATALMRAAATVAEEKMAEEDRES